MYTSKTSRAIGSTGQPNDAQTTGYSLKTIGEDLKKNLSYIICHMINCSSHIFFLFIDL